MNKKIMIIVIVLLVGIAGFFTLKENDEETIKIGLIVALSGPFPEGGQNLLNGVQLAVDEVNARGGVNGRPLEIVVEDGAFDINTEIQAFASIEESVKPLFYITQLNTVIRKIPDLAEEREVVLLQLVISDFIGSSEWTFQYGLNNEKMNKPIIELLEYLNVEKLGMMYPDYLPAIEETNQFEEALEAKGKTLESNSIAFGQTDYTSEIKALDGTDAIYFLGANQDVPLLVEQARALGYTGSILTVPPYYEAVPFEIPANEIVYLSAPAIYNPQFLFAQEAAELYRSHYAEPFNLNAGFGYDTIHLMSDLLEGEELTRSNVKNVLDQGFSYSGVFGNVNLPTGLRDISISLSPAKIVNGTLEYLG